MTATAAARAATAAAAAAAASAAITGSTSASAALTSRSATSAAVANSAAPNAAVTALQAALAAENAAIYGYGIAGAQLTGSQQIAAQRDWNLHREARGTLAAMITTLGAQPVPAEAAYRLPFPVHTAHAATALAVLLEDGVTAAYLGLVAVSAASLRTFGALAMQACAERATSWRGTAAAFPGLTPG
jgi:hypothetical protein